MPHRLSRRAVPRRVVSRRAVLGGAITLPFLLTACTSESETPIDPDRVALEAALDVERDLQLVVASVRSSVKGTGRDAVQVLGAVQAHVDALDAALGPSPSGTDASSSPAPSATAASVADAIRAADRAADAHQRALRSASAAITPLLASIAASDAAIAAYLRPGEQ